LNASEEKAFGHIEVMIREAQDRLNEIGEPSAASLLELAVLLVFAEEDLKVSDVMSHISGVTDDFGIKLTPPLRAYLFTRSTSEETEEEEVAESV